ncbi:unnamed protein product [Cylicocyclus nassatus]|uniref:Uncharacterized protein n=1 Tax=Cylicocyclus nassatus TaxID=53992 RepID=A0AA36GJK0_CYLNA|nr:unnamed protein product [Cylicocyclus nassatus]
MVSKRSENARNNGQAKSHQTSEFDTPENTEHDLCNEIHFRFGKLSKMTGAEKDSLMFVLFPLVAAKTLCCNSVGSVCILVYWLLVRVLANVEEFNIEDTEAASNLAKAIKELWISVSTKLFTLKLYQSNQQERFSQTPTGTGSFPPVSWLAATNDTRFFYIFTGALKRILEKNTVSLAKLGRVVRQFDIIVENEDLPEGVVDFLISFVLDAVGLYRDELLRTPNEHKQNLNRWWMSLGEEDDAREKFFNKLSEARVDWSGRARIAIGRALADIRTYHLDPERDALLPSKKKRVVIEGSEGSSIIKELVIEKAECVGDERD